MTDPRTDSPSQLLTTIVPKADEKFQQELEGRLMSHLYSAQTEEKIPMQAVLLTHRPRPMVKSTWAAMIATVMMALIGVALIQMNQNRSAVLQDVPAMALTATRAPVPAVGLTLDSDTLQGLEVGDRVDILVYLEGRIRMLVADVRISEIKPTVVMFDAPLWQQGIIIWLSQTGEPYALRVHTGEDIQG